MNRVAFATVELELLAPDTLTFTETELCPVRTQEIWYLSTDKIEVWAIEGKRRERKSNGVITVGSSLSKCITAWLKRACSSTGTITVVPCEQCFIVNGLVAV